jgi:hypothetical protein
MKFLKRLFTHITKIINLFIIQRYVNIALVRRLLSQVKQKGKNFIGVMKLRFQRKRIVTKTFIVDGYSFTANVMQDQVFLPLRKQSLYISPLQDY